MPDPGERFQEALEHERGGAIERALKEYEAILETTDEPSLVARTLVRMAHAWRTRCDWDRALAAARRATGTALYAGLRAEQGEALNAEAAVHHTRGHFADATAIYEEILELTDDPRVRGMALQNLGAIAAVQGDADAAERRFGEAAEAFSQAGDLSGQAYVLNNYTALALDRRDFALAEERALEALGAAMRLRDFELLGVARINQTEALGGLERFAEAELAAAEALGHFRSTGNVWRQVQCLRHLGDLDRRQGGRSARQCYARALAMAEEIDAEEEVAWLRERLEALEEA